MGDGRGAAVRGRAEPAAARSNQLSTIADRLRGADTSLAQTVAPPGPPLLLAPREQAHVDVMFTGPSPDDGLTPWIPQTITLTLPFSAGILSLPWTSNKPLEPYLASSHPPTFTGPFIAGP